MIDKLVKYKDDYDPFYVSMAAMYLQRYRAVDAILVKVLDLCLEGEKECKD